MKYQSEEIILVDRRSRSWSRAGNRKILQCPKCKASLSHCCLKNGVKYVVGEPEQPIKIYNADLYRCSECHSMILTDFGTGPINKSDIMANYTEPIDLNTEELRQYIEMLKHNHEIIIFGIRQKVKK